MAFPFDFTVLDAHGHAAVVVEATSKLGTNARWASRRRQRIADDSTAFGSSAFLLVTPDRLYAWPASAASDAAPSTEIDGEQVLGRYLERAGVQKGRNIDPYVFEWIVESWLQDVASGVAPAPTTSGFDQVTAALRGARVVAERAA